MARSFPSMLEYQEAIQNPQNAFGDLELKGGSVVLDALGLPKPITGGFASVYQIKTKTKHFAVRCFLRPPASVAERYSQISAFVRRHRPQWMSEFTYLDQGIKVHGQWYPVLKMEWIQGEPFNLYVARLVGQKKALFKLADQFLDLLEQMEKLKVAHGDLQHGNIIVSQDKLRLIDYDAMFLEGMKGPSAEVGHRNYQHPRRSEKDFGLYLDHFSAWVIHLSIKALAHQPDLWLKLDGGDEGLLFRKEDFMKPDQSKAFREIEQIKDPEINESLEKLRNFLKTECAQIESPVFFLKSPNKSEKKSSKPSLKSSSSTKKNSLFTTLLPSKSQAKATPSKPPPPMSNASSGLFMENPTLERLTLGISLLIVCGTLFFYKLNTVSYDELLVLCSLTGLLMTVVLWIRYWTLPLVQKKRLLLSELYEIEEDLETCSQKLKILDLLEQEIQKTHKLDLKALGELTNTPEQEDILTDLEDFLGQQLWQPGKVPGIDDGLAKSLRQKGFKDAGQFEDMIVTRSLSDGETNEKITLLLSTGRSLADPLLTRQTAPIIFAWRRQGEVKFVTDTKVKEQILLGELSRKKLETQKACDALSQVSGQRYLEIIVGLRP